MITFLRFTVQKKRMFIFLIYFLCLFFISANIFVSVSAESVELHNPNVKEDETMKAGQTVLYDCIYFGSYPQSIVDVNNPIYTTLTNQKDWDENNECTVNGTKYRKVILSNKNEEYFFEYLPIKWRVIEINETDILLLADMALDSQPYQYSDSESDWPLTNWKLCSLRTYLNGIFYNSSFSEDEKKDIEINQTIYCDNLVVEDKVFLLSDQEVRCKKYGFNVNGWLNGTDEARRCIATDYAKIMVKESIKDPCYWWCIEVTGASYETIQTSSLVDDSGWVYGMGNDFVTVYEGASVRPVIRISKNSKLWSYAGTVTSEKMKDYSTTKIPISTELPIKTTEPASSPTKAPDSTSQALQDSPKPLDDLSTTAYPTDNSNIRSSAGTILIDNQNKISYKVIEPEKTVAFYNLNNKKATKAVIPATITINGKTYKVTEISNNAFRGCNKLQNVTMGKNIKNIGNGAFSKCKKLKKIVIPENVKKIGKRAFWECKNLKTIVIKTKKLKNKSVGLQIFKGIYKKAIIKVPKKQKAAYQKWLKKKGVANTIKIK